MKLEMNHLKLHLSSFKHLNDKLDSIGFQMRIVQSDETETSVLSCRTMPHTASVCPFKYFTNTDEAVIKKKIRNLIVVIE